MRSLSIALVALVVAVSGTGVFRDLSAINKNSLAISTTAADGSSGYAILNLVTPSSYVADGLTIFPLSYNISYTGTLPTSDNIFYMWNAYMTVTGPGGFPNYVFGASCTAPNAQPSDAGTGVSGIYTRLSAGLVGFTGGAQFGLTTAGTYTGTIFLQRFGQPAAQSATFTFTVATTATAPTKIQATIDTFSLQASQTNSTPGIYVALTPASIDVASLYTVRVAFNAPATQSVVYQTARTNSGGFYDGGFSKLTPYVGYWCGNSFVPYAGIGLTGGELPQATTLTVGGITIAKSGGSNSLAAPTGNTQFVSTVGSTDVTAPTCTAAAFASTTSNTGDGSAFPTYVAVTSTCTDGTGTVAYSGTIVRTTSGSLTADFLVENTDNLFVPPFLNGNAEIIGVVAIDTAGNGAVYGSCGTLAGELATLCGGSASSTLIASLAVVMMCIMAVLAL